VGPIGQQIAIPEMELKAISINFQDEGNPTVTVLLENGGHPHPVTLRSTQAIAIIQAMREKFPGLESWFLHAIAHDLNLPEGEIE
jgi:hypothetical protein